MGNPFADLRAALGMFTLLPVGTVLNVDQRVARRLMAAFPWAGAVCGVLAGTVAAAVVFCRAGDGLAAAAGLATLAGVTGAMHLDGVADTADGLASRKDAAAALALMKRSDIGPMGVATLVFVLLLQAAALASLHGWSLVAALVVVPLLGRVPVLHATVAGIPSARPGAFGALFTGVTPRPVAVLDSLAALVVATGIGWLAGGWRAALAVLVATSVGWLVALGWRRHLLRRLGGLTGDAFGSLIEVTQTVMAVVISLVLGMLRP